MIVRVLLALIILAVGLPVAYGADRVAFVIGNSSYSHAQALPNPGADAAAVASSLERLGFDVTLQKDLTKAAFELALADFSDKAAGADIALVFYAGHGMELDGQNYLVPVDARLNTDLRVKFETVSLEDVLASVEGARGLKLVLLDACRDNPFITSMTRRIATRSLGRGLAKVETAPGILVSFAAAAGTVAEDGTGRHSPYTTALLEHLETPGLELSLLFRKVADDVQTRTNGRQTPFEYGRLPGNSIFLTPAEEVPATAASEQNLCRDAATHWTAVSNTRNAGLLEEHIRRFGDCAFASLARHALSELQASAATGNADIAGISDRSAQATDAQGERKAEQDLAGALKDEPAAVVADAARIEESSEAIDTEKPDQPVEIAALPTDERDEETAGSLLPEVAEPEKTPAELTLAVQQALEKLGCNPGQPDGLWGPRSLRALETFSRETGVSLDTSKASLAALNALSKHSGRVCPLSCAVTETDVGGRCVAKTCPGGQTLNSRGQCYTPTAKSIPVAREGRSTNQRSSGQVQRKDTAKARAAVRLDVKPTERQRVQRTAPFSKKCIVMTFCDD